LNFINTKLHEEYGLFVDGYYIQVPAHAKLYSRFLDYYTIPGPALNKDGRPSESSYCTAWALTFLEYVQPEKTIQDYPVFLEKYRIDVSGDQMYMSGSFNYPGSFSSPTAMLGTFFTGVLAKQRGDYNTVNRIQNFLNSRYNKVWSEDGRMMYYDTSSLISFLQPVVAGLRIMSTTPVTVRDLAESRSNQFWNYPFIYKADDDNIWVYQAQWDPDKDAFILNIKVDKTATLSFKNFHHKPTAYSAGAPFEELSPFGNDYMLTLEPGIYNLVII